MSDIRHKNLDNDRTWLGLTGADLKAWRKSVGLRQNELADILEVSRATISNLEARTANLPMVYRLAIHAIQTDPSVVRIQRDGFDGRPKNA